MHLSTFNVFVMVKLWLNIKPRWSRKYGRHMWLTDAHLSYAGYRRQMWLMPTCHDPDRRWQQWRSWCYDPKRRWQIQINSGYRNILTVDAHLLWHGKNCCLPPCFRRCPVSTSCGSENQLVPTSYDHRRRWQIWPQMQHIFNKLEW